MARGSEVHKPKPPNRKADVIADLTRLKGQSRSELERDDRRMSTSPFGGRKGTEQRRGP
jgi:hypothetical protein